MKIKKSTINISIVIPVYNNTEHLQALLYRISMVAKENNINYEIIIVDDGSSWLTWNELVLIKKSCKDTHVRLISLKRNLSQNIATFYGVEHSKHNLIITMDSDLQHLPEDIPKLINHLLSEKLKVVYAFPKDIKSLPVTSICFKKITSIIDRQNYNFASSYRAFDKKTIKEDLTKPKKTWYWAIDTLLYSSTSKIDFIKVEKRNRIGSSYNFSKKIIISIKHIINDKKFYIFGFLSSLIIFITSFYQLTSNYAAYKFDKPNMVFCLAIIFSITKFIFLFCLLMKTRASITVDKKKIRTIIH